MAQGTAERLRRGGKRMSHYSQDVRDGLIATLKARQDKYKAHANSRDPSMREPTPMRMDRLLAHVVEAQLALDAHVELHGPDGIGPVAPEFGVFMLFAGDKKQIFVDGRPLTIDDIAAHFNITEEAITNE